ncbi:MAG: paraslipin [Rickettsiales bacterium]|nr:paraslipin [Rickettsiales bacterium]
MLDFSSVLSLTLAFGVVLIVWKGVKIVPQQESWIVERLGKFDRNLIAGLNILIPFVDRVSYKHSLKEYANDVQEQTAITRDNVTLIMDGVIYTRITDAKQASYGVSNPIYAVTQLAQTTMRSEIGKLTLDQCFEEREVLNANIVNAINEAAQTWGIQCMRYEIRNITPPHSVLQAMELQVAAERKKRAEILDSEGQQQSQINIAEAQKQEVVLESEASKIDQINRAQGEAEAIREVAIATAEGIRVVAGSIIEKGGTDAVALKVAEQYVAAFGNLAKESNTILMPANANDAGSMVAQAMSVFNQVRMETADAASTSKSPWKK